MPAERSTLPIPTKSLPTPSASDDGEPANNAPIGWIEHGTGPTDVVDPAHFPNGRPGLPSDSVWDVVGHINDQAAANCRHPAVNLTCRTTFVVTSLDRFEGIDPG